MVELFLKDNIQLKKYEDVITSLKDMEALEGKVWIDGNFANVAVYK